MARRVVEHVRAKRTIYNFRQPVEASQSEQAEEAPGTGSSAEDEAARQQEAEALRLQRKEQEEKLEALRREEHQRLERHSEPLRQYLTGLVVPTLTSGLIDLCREQPEDPVGYLAEYLSVYAQVAKTHGKRGLAPGLA
ncbi:unnamed protein product [Prorocentrum cordatum]|uniref:Protein dpy-30 homolog n=1 Tax=Prorocentrum cordatum TaxID=2364126 RepID=A0ABN9WAI8_9DINO|nr:unnamed protein product [Polarella glacialis]